MAEQVAWKELERAERSGDVREEAAARWTVAVALVDGPRPVPDCLRVCDDLVRWRGGEHFGVQADVVSATGRSRDARTYLRRAVALYERKGNVAAAGLATAKLR